MNLDLNTSVSYQAIRIPEELRADAIQVEIERKGESLVLRPLPNDQLWPEGYIESFAAGRLDESFVRPSQGD